jgi:hypothetical protein
MVFTSFSLKNDSDWLVKEAVAAKNDKKQFLTYDSKEVLKNLFLIGCQKGLSCTR